MVRPSRRTHGEECEYYALNIQLQMTQQLLTIQSSHSVIEPDDEILTSEDGTISTCKQFSFTALGNKDLQLERLEETLVMGQPQSSVESVLEFRQRARMLLKQWMSNVQKQLT
jgi:hypothetical protein